MAASDKPAKAKTRRPRNKTVGRTRAGLTDKQEAFAHEYVRNGRNAAAAYRKVYETTTPRVETVHVAAWQVVSHPAVAKRIDQLTERARERMAVTTERLILEAARVAFADPGALFDVEVDDNGQPQPVLKPITDMDEDIRRAIAGVEVRDEYRDGVKVGTVTKLKLATKVAAISELASILGLKLQRTREEGGGGTLIINIPESK